MKKVEIENEHHRNLANFDVLVAKVISLGPKYKPIRTAIHVSALKLVSQNAKNALSNVAHLEQKYEAIKQQHEQFYRDQLQLMAMLKPYILETTAMTEVELYLVSGCKPLPLSGNEINLRHDFLLKNWSKLIHLIKTLSCYEPTKEEIQIVYLEDFYTRWFNKHKEFKEVEAYLSAAQAIREEVFYRNRYGLVAIAGIVKSYIKFNFGWHSSTYKQILALPIRRSKWDNVETSKVAEYI